MSKKILIISSSIRNKSNSEILAREAEKGAIAAGNEVEFISLKNKDLRFCKGCLACQKTMKCVIKDDVAEIMEKVKMQTHCYLQHRFIIMSSADNSRHYLTD
jgi:multimeric flavodoxin WrbA